MLKKMTKTAMARRGRVVRAWAWQLGDGCLCYWSHPSIEALENEPKPSPEAKPVRVVMMTESIYSTLKSHR